MHFYILHFTLRRPFLHLRTLYHSPVPFPSNDGNGDEEEDLNLKRKPCWSRWQGWQCDKSNEDDNDENGDNDKNDDQEKRRLMTGGRGGGVISPALS